MPTYVLEPGRALRLPARAFKVHLSPGAGLPPLTLTTRGPLRAYQLTAQVWLVQHAPAETAADDTDLVPAAEAVGPEDAETAATLGVSSVDGAVLAPGAQLSLFIETEGGGGYEAEAVKVPPQDLAGTSGRDLLTVRIVSREMELALAVAHRAVKRLSSEASAMVAHTRSYRSRQNPPPVPFGVTVLLDDSASMDTWFEAGHIGDIVDGLFGVSEALEKVAGFHVVLGTEPVAHGTEPRSAIAQARLSRGHRTGFTSAAMAQRSPSAVTFVVTDAPPADLAALEARHDSGDLRHLVLVMDVDAYAACGVTTGVPVTLWPHHTLMNEDLVHSLLSNAVTAPTQRHERVGS